MVLAAFVFSGCSLLDLLTESTADGYQPAVQSRLDTTQYHGYGFNALTTDDERQLYAYIDVAANKLKSESFKIIRNSAYKRIGDIIEFYKNDYPEVFWLREDAPYSYLESDTMVTIELNFKKSGTELLEAKNGFREKLEEIAALAPQNASAYETELFINDYLVDHCIYDKEAVEMHKENQVRANEQNAYGALMEGKVVCEGYARAFQLLCMRLGLECKVVEGYAVGFNNTRKTPHIWNCVKLDGDWYHVDTTWNDSDVDSDIYTDRYYYMNLTTEEIEKDHIINPCYSEYTTDDILYNDYVPECVSDEYYYFKRNAMVIKSLKNDSVAQKIAKAAADKKTYCDFVIDDSLDFDEVNRSIAETYGAKWITEANEINGNSPRISFDSKMNVVAIRRIITIVLAYE